MNTGEMFAALRSRGMEILREIFDGGASAAEIAVLMGRRRADAHRFAKTAKALFGPCAAEDREFRQRAILAGERFGLSADALAVIQTRVRMLANDLDYSREQLRAEITESCQGLDVDTIDALARQRVRELNVTSESKPASRAFISKPDAHHKVYLTAYLDAHVVQGFVDAVEDRAGALYDREGTESFHNARGRALEEALRSASRSQEGLGVHAIITVDELQGNITRDTISATDGTTLDRRTLLDAHIAPTGWITVIDAVGGLPENSYRMQRYANTKQRATLAAHDVLCAGPGCTIAAKYCQAHHTKEWSCGGETNLDQLVLVMLCPYHHGLVTKGEANVQRDNTGTLLWKNLKTQEISTNRQPATEHSGLKLARNRQG